MPQKQIWFGMGSCIPVLLLGFAMALQAAEPAKTPQLPYDLAQVRHIQAFVGSPRAKDLLSRQGFVVTEEHFRQIFEPYLPATKVKMPTFITVDSVWHTYHILLEEGVQQLELDQARLLQRFSERLYRLAAAKDLSKVVYHDLAAFAAVGWAAQDPGSLQRLPADQRDEVTGALNAMKSGGLALFFQLPLQPQNFLPAGFYTKTPELAHYFVARRWYATSAFRLKSESETLRALHLTLLVESDGELKRLHRQLTASPETMVGPADDPGVAKYVQLASKLAQGPLTAEKIPQILSDFRREARKLPGPRINDQLLSPEQFAAREEETKGMRVFGASQLPSAILFQNTTEPVIAKRMLPSGVEVFAAGPLACDAGRRALKAMTPDTATFEAICRVNCGPLPDSLHGRAMQLLRLIQEPLPGTAPMALRTPAWQDKQLWTALGAWAEERHTWVLHSKPTMGPLCMFEESPGYVSPYPKFYRQLGQLARRAAAILTRVAAESDVAVAGRKWLEARQAKAQSQWAPTQHDKWVAGVLGEPMEDDDAADRMAHAMAEYFRGVGKNVQAVNVLERAAAWQELDSVAKRCVEDKGVTDHDRRCMRAFLCSPEGNATQLLPEFATLCDQLATIAEKELAGQRLDRKELQLIQGYGETLARFHFYEGMTWLSSRDDFSCVTPVFSNPLREKSLYVGVSRPEAVYVILFNGKCLVLHRGAVLSYREFSRPSGDALNDKSWQEQVNASLAPPPPALTASFRSRISPKDREQMVQESAGQLREGRLDVEDFAIVGHGATLVRIDLLLKKWQALKTSQPVKKDDEPTKEVLNASEMDDEVRERNELACVHLLESILGHAVDEDVPDLLDKVLPMAPEESIQELFYGLVRLNWKPYRDRIVTLAHHARPAIAEGAAILLGSVPADLDIEALAKNYNQQPPHIRGVYCYLIRQSQQSGPEVKRILAAGLREPSWEVRYQAAIAVASSRVTSEEILIAIREGMNDEQLKVAAAMVHAVVALGLTDTAPQLLRRLKKHVEGAKLGNDDGRPNLNLEDWAVRSLTVELIKGLSEFKYLPAKEIFRIFVFPNAAVLKRSEFGEAAFEALLKIDPQNKKQLLTEIFQDERSADTVRHSAIFKVCKSDNIEYVRTMLPLFENVGSTSGQQSIAVWAAPFMVGMLERAAERDPEAAKLFETIRGVLLRQTHGLGARDALFALQYFDPAMAARECVAVALDKEMPQNVRTTAIPMLEAAPKPWPIRELLPLLKEVPEDNDSILSVGYYVARAIGRLSAKLDSNIPQEAETRQMVQTTFEKMLKGPRGALATEGLIAMSEDGSDVLLSIACNRSLPYATREHALSEMHEHCGPECARRLISLLSDDARPDDDKPTIAQLAADAIARICHTDRWDGEEPAAEFIRKARGWAEAAEAAATK